MTKKIITRFPPSPTGPFHIGNVRTALFNFLFAKHNDGIFLVRIEDTDKERSKKEYEIRMLEGLKWLGLDRDGELWRQSERTEIYRKYLQKLIDEDKVYYSTETEGKNKEVLRFRNPNKTVSFEDEVRGQVKFDTTELGDFIIAKNIEEPLYHLTVVVDDFEAGITHVIRGEDHISNTPRQILIQEAIGAPRPIYAHLPLIMAKDRSKLSKRKHGEFVSLDYYRQKEYLPQALINYLALLGWNPGTEQEIFTIKKLIEAFNLSQINKSGGIFDEKKLDWVNREHLKLLPQKERQKIATKDFDFQNVPILIKEKICWKETTTEETIKHLIRVQEIIDQEQNVETAGEIILSYATKAGKGNVLWPTRYALTGLDVSPDPITIIQILNKNESIKRLDKAIDILKQ